MPKAFIQFDPKPSQINTLQKKRKLASCEFEILPQPPKLESADDAFLLYGNIPVIQKGDEIWSDFSLLNEFHIYYDVYITTQENQRLISITTERRPEKRFPRWKTSTKKISQYKNSTFKQAARVMKNYCLDFEKVISNFIEQSNQTIHSKELSGLFETQASELSRTREELFSTYPCLELRSSFKGYQTELREVVLNDSFLQLSGYSVDSFASNVLNEGIPQFICHNLQDELNFQSTKLESPSGSVRSHLQSQTCNAILVTKSGYKKHAKIQIQSFMEYEKQKDKFWCNTIFVVLEQSSPFLYGEESFTLPPNKRFVEIMCQKESQISQFLLEYYDYSTFPMYSNLHKVCKIKELKDIYDDE